MSIDHHDGQPSRLLPRTIEDVLRSWMLRGGGLLLIVSAALVSLAMLTWSANDPSLLHNTSESAQNLLGYFGAVIADFFFHTLGLSVVFFVVPPLILGLQLLLGDTITNHRRRIAMMAISTVAIAAGCSALPLMAHWPLELGYGGIIGDFAYSLVASMLAELAPNAGGAVAGLLFFVIGFWAFSRAVCLDRYNIFAVKLPTWRLHRGSAAADPVEPAHISDVLWHRDAGHPLPGKADRGYYEATNRPVEHWTFDREPARSDGGPLAWSMDELISSYQFGPAVNAAAVPHEPTGTAQTEEPQLQSPTILLDDELDSGTDDLPNVLKRAREEVAELLPTRRRDPNPHKLAMPKAVRPSAGWPDGIPSPNNAAPQRPKVVATGYRRPSLNLLKAQKAARPSADSSPSVLQGRARMLQDVLGDFRIKGEIRDVRPGPVITMFELEPSRGTKTSRVIALADDVARSMSATSARISVVPGRNAIGIELPNTRRETFGLRELIDSQAFVDSCAKLPLVLGKGIDGETVLTDLARMPHLLVAGTTGSGKSVGVNAMIVSLIYRLSPQDCRFLMIDPKMLELSAYNGIPHLLTPVITDPQKAVTALSWAVGEMEERYKRMAEMGVRNVEAFNNRVRHAQRMGEKIGRKVQTGFNPNTGAAVYEETVLNAEPLPYIVIIVDEFADLMAVAGKEIEALVQRLAQMARAAGIHMIMATQRPSVDVVTGTIKANFPTRISYRVASRIDSRTILNEQGAEQLLGQGDMLFLGSTGDVQRVHGPFVSDEEVEAVTGALRSTYPSDYVADLLNVDKDSAEAPLSVGQKGDDLYEQAVAIVLRDQKASTSYLQRRLSIGYNRAADLIDRMETNGVIGPANHAGRRDILLAS